MSTPSTRNDLKTLYRLIEQADLVLDTIPHPHASMASARESLAAARALSKDLIRRKSTGKPETAAELGAMGGNATLAKRGSEYFKRISAMRKSKKGGRPSKPPRRQD